MLIGTLLAALTWSLVRTRAFIALGADEPAFPAQRGTLPQAQRTIAPAWCCWCRKDDGAIVYRNAAARIGLSAGGGSTEFAALFDPESIARLCNARDGSQGWRLMQMRDADGAQF